jgi:hypothetical protein
MAYVRPDTVLSPKKRVGGILEVIHDPGEGGMSVARILWDGKPVIATRWNGNNRQPLGNPMSRRQPTWFVLDDYAALKVEEAAREAADKSPNSLLAQYREMANDSAHEAEADEWSEGLIGDASEEG